MRRDFLSVHSTSSWMAAGICLALALLSWSGYTAIREWRRSSLALAQRRTNDAADLLLIALRRDMRGVEETVLHSSQWSPEMIGSGNAMTRLLASAFARYPYPEAFFGWRGEPTSENLVFFNRADRLPPWLPNGCASEQVPINTCRDGAVAGQFTRVLSPPPDGSDMSIVETAFGGEPYELVTRFVYADPFRERVVGGLGFTVNLAWARRAYVSRLAEQVAPIAGVADGLSLAIIDDTSARVWDTSPAAANGPVSRRTFSLVFADPLLNQAARSQRRWSLEVHSSEARRATDPLWLADRLEWLFGIAVVAAALALQLAIRSHNARLTAQLAQLRSEFGASITHELKTPIASIHALGEAITSRRVSSEKTVREYAQLVVDESKRLARLVDNSLAYARITDGADMLRFEPLDVQALFDDALARFGSRLVGDRFEVTLNLPPDLPSVEADRTAMTLLIDNVLDNAVRYSGASRWLEICGCARSGSVEISIADHGIGIPEDELPHVTQKFFRGRRSAPGGSGLGLAIATRIIDAHRGTLRIDSTVNQGTTVRLELPAAE